MPLSASESRLLSASLVTLAAVVAALNDSRPPPRPSVLPLAPALSPNAPSRSGDSAGSEPLAVPREPERRLRASDMLRRAPSSVLGVLADITRTKSTQGRPLAFFCQYLLDSPRKRVRGCLCAFPGEGPSRDERAGWLSCHSECQPSRQPLKQSLQCSYISTKFAAAIPAPASAP